MTDHALLVLAMGAAIGYAAAQHRGYAPMAGIVAGAVMGPLWAWILFAVDGIVQAHERQRCLYCRKWMEPHAIACAHCGRQVRCDPPAGPAGLRLVYSRRH